MLKKIMLSILVAFSVSCNASSKDIVVHAIEMPPLIINQKEGVVVERVKQVMECSRINHTISIKPWARSFTETRNKSGALIPTMKTKEREAFLWYPDTPVYQVTYHFFEKAGIGRKWDGDYASLKDLTIGKLRGGAVGEEFDKLAESGYFKLSEASDFEQLKRLAARNRVDLIAADKGTIEYLCNCDDKRGEVELIDGPPISQRNIYIAFNQYELTVSEKQIVNQCHTSIGLTEN